MQNNLPNLPDANLQDNLYDSRGRITNHLQLTGDLAVGFT